jgi:hypothetical protein
MSRTALVFLVFSSLSFAFAGACSEKQGISVKNIHPTRGPYLGGDPVTISGSGFSPTLIDSVRFGKNKARPPVVKENGDIIVDPPAGNLNETVDIEIILNDARTIKIPQAYTYIDPTATTPVK